MQALRPEEPRPLRQFGTAILTSLISVALVIGGLSLALSENAPGRPQPPDGLPALELTLTALAPAAAPSSQATIPSTTSTVPGTTGIPPFTPTNAGGVSTLSTVSGNCGAPFGWVKNYVVRPGDTMFRIALSYSSTTAALQQANCKGSSTAINVGEVLWVPNVAPLTPGVTIIPTFGSSTPIPTDPLTETPLPFTASPSATNTTAPTQTPPPTVTPITPES